MKYTLDQLQNKDLQKYIDTYIKDMFETLHNTTSDYDVLELGTEILKIARDRLNGDLEDKEIYYEYRQLDDIVYRLNIMLKQYR